MQQEFLRYAYHCLVACGPTVFGIAELFQRDTVMIFGRGSATIHKVVEFQSTHILSHPCDLLVTFLLQGVHRNRRHRNKRWWFGSSYGRSDRHDRQVSDFRGLFEFRTNIRGYRKIIGLSYAPKQRLFAQPLYCRVPKRGLHRITAINLIPCHRIPFGSYKAVQRHERNIWLGGWVVLRSPLNHHNEGDLVVLKHTLVIWV